MINRITHQAAHSWFFFTGMIKEIDESAMCS
jgi:hypothetical protein